jgi:glucose-6-phosphate dehydrogenase assembly protein OpcA
MTTATDSPPARFTLVDLAHVEALVVEHCRGVPALSAPADVYAGWLARRNVLSAWRLAEVRKAGPLLCARCEGRGCVRCNGDGWSGVGRRRLRRNRGA